MNEEKEEAESGSSVNVRRTTRADRSRSPAMSVTWSNRPLPHLNVTKTRDLHHVVDFDQPLGTENNDPSMQSEAVVVVKMVKKAMDKIKMHDSARDALNVRGERNEKESKIHQDGDDVESQWRLHGSPTLPEAMSAAEHKWIWSRRLHLLGSSTSKRSIERSALPKVGLSFSGGGVRSAAFQTGVLKAMSHFKNECVGGHIGSKRPWLYFVDYLSTVSGGGYAGASFMTHVLAEETFQRENEGNVTSADVGKTPMERLASTQRTPRIKMSDQKRLLGALDFESAAKIPLTPPSHSTKAFLKRSSVHVIGSTREGKEDLRSEETHFAEETEKMSRAFSMAESHRDRATNSSAPPRVNLSRCVDSMYKNMHDNCDFLFRTSWTDFTSDMLRGSLCCRSAPKYAIWPRIFDLPMLTLLLPVLMCLNAVRTVLQLVLFAIWMEYFAGDNFRVADIQGNQTFYEWVKTSRSDYDVGSIPFAATVSVIYVFSYVVVVSASMRCCGMTRETSNRVRRMGASAKMASALLILFVVMLIICLYMIHTLHKQRYGEFFLASLVAAIFLATFAQTNKLSLCVNGQIKLIEAGVLVLVVLIGPVLYLVIFSLICEWRVFGDAKYNGTSVMETTFGTFNESRWSQVVLISSSLLIVSVVCWERLLSYVQEHYRLALAASFFVHGASTTVRQLSACAATQSDAISRISSRTRK